MGLSEEERQLISDHEAAQTYGTKYLGRMNNELFARGLILTNAMDAYNSFLTLKPGDSKASLVWDLAFNVLATAVPMLKLAKFIDQQHKAATLAYDVAKAVRDRGQQVKSKAVVLATGAAKAIGKVAPKIDDAKDKLGKITEPAGKLMESDPAEEAKSELTKRLDASRKVTRGLIEDGNNALIAWEKALDTELLTFDNKLAGRDKSKKTQLEQIKELLPPIPTFTDAEYGQIELKYKWLMIAEYCRSNVAIVTTTHTLWIHTTLNVDTMVTSETKIQGLNSEQQKQIVEWFGPATHRGKIFTEIPVKTAMDYLRAVKAPVLQKSTSSSSFSETTK